MDETDQQQNQEVAEDMEQDTAQEQATNDGDTAVQGSTPTPDENTQQATPTPDENTQQATPTPDENTQQATPTPDENTQQATPTPDENTQQATPTPDENTQQATPIPDENTQQATLDENEPDAPDEPVKEQNSSPAPEENTQQAAPDSQAGSVASPKLASGHASPAAEQADPIVQLSTPPPTPPPGGQMQHTDSYEHRSTPSPEDMIGRAGMGPPPAQPEGSLGRAPGGPPPPPLPQHDHTGDYGTMDDRIPTAPPIPGSEPQNRQEKENLNALNLVWSYGMSLNVPVINLCNDERKLIAYACGHTGVLYNIHNNTQILLQGHANSIASMCTSGDHRWLATADIGNDNMIIVWDTLNGNPVRTIFDPHPDGAVTMAMTPDARYLVSVSLGQDEDKQTVAIWDWTVESETPLCTAELHPDYGTQNYILFNPVDTTQLVSNSDSQVIFYSWQSGQLDYFAPPLTDDDFHKPVGKYSQSIFLGSTTRALTATSLGNLVVWDTNKPLTKVVSTETTPDKKALKLVKLQERGLTVLTTSESFIVAGDVLGHVKFFDYTLKLVNWYQDLHLGPIKSISFAHIPDFGCAVPANNEYPNDATIQSRKFLIRDFVIGTTNAVFAHCYTDGTNVEVIHRDHDAAVHAIDAHPKQSKFAVGSYSGLLKVWDYDSKEVVVSRRFDHGLMIRSCAYDPKGLYIAVGFTNGSLYIVDAVTLDNVLQRPYHYARDAITHIAFSHDSSFLATADAEYTTTVYKINPERGDPYVYMGRHRAHYKTINGLLFGKQLDGEAPRLLSLAEDRHLVEYELDTERDELRIASCDRIEQSATPYCMAWYPPITKESFLMSANDQFKLKLYNSTTKMCRKTLLGPTYGTPLQQMLVLPTPDPINDTRYMAYITENKIGLHKLPLDGNPHNAMALNSHPVGVSQIVSSHDGKYLFTAGGKDSTVHMWNINLQALEAQAKLGGEGLIPFYGLLDGGRDGELFRELEDYFYYAQIRSQGVDTTESRDTSVTIPVAEIPYVARAMGFYPSEQEIEDMKNEVKYNNYVETGEYTTDIDLGDFIKLYINHRPVFGLQPHRLEDAFETLGISTADGSIIDRGELLDILQNRGEHIKEYDLAEYLMTLLGYTDEGGSSELHQFDTANAGTLIDQSLPQDITSEMFADDLLGFGLYNSNMLQVEETASQQLA